LGFMLPVDARGLVAFVAATATFFLGGASSSESDSVCFRFAVTVYCLYKQSEVQISNELETYFLGSRRRCAASRTLARLAYGHGYNGTTHAFFGDAGVTGFTSFISSISSSEIMMYVQFQRLRRARAARKRDLPIAIAVV